LNNAALLAVVQEHFLYFVHFTVTSCPVPWTTELVLGLGLCPEVGLRLFKYSLIPMHQTASFSERPEHTANARSPNLSPRKLVNEDFYNTV